MNLEVHGCVMFFFANTFYTVVSGVNTLLHLLSFLYVAVFKLSHCYDSDEVSDVWYFSDSSSLQ